MPPLSARALTRRLRSHPPAERAAFVADLWAARGYDTTVEGAVVVAERAGDGTRHRIACGSPTASDDVDAVLALGASATDVPTEDVHVIDGEDLRRILLYAVDRETAGELSATHLNRSLVGESATGPPGSRIASGSGRPPILVGLVALLVVLVTIGAAGGGFPFAGKEPDLPLAPVPATGTPSAPPPGTAPNPIGVTGQDRPQGGGDLFRYPPGIGPSGVTNASALADAHRATLAGTAWKLQLSHNRSHDLIHPFVRWRTAEQSIARASATRYRFEVTGVASLENGSGGSVTYVDYGDGSANYRRLIGLHGNAYERTRLPEGDPPGVFATVSAAYVRRYLSTTESRVGTVRVGNTTRTRVVATGVPTELARTVANYTAVAVVDRRGVVRTLTVEYTLLERAPDPTPNGVATPYASPDDVPTEPIGTVRFTMRFAPIKAASLNAPSWYDDARNATNATGLEPWPNDPAV